MRWSLKKGLFLRLCGDKFPLSPYLPPGQGCVNQFSLVLASSSSIANEAYPRSINMNHDRLTLYYRSTISHFLLDLLNPTGTGVGAARPSNHLAVPEEGRLRPNKDQAEPMQCWTGTWGQRLPNIHMQNMFIILHLYNVLLTKCTALPLWTWKSNDSLPLEHNIWRDRLGFLQGVSFTYVFLLNT